MNRSKRFDISVCCEFILVHSVQIQHHRVLHLQFILVSTFTLSENSCLLKYTKNNIGNFRITKPICLSTAFLNKVYNFLQFYLFLAYILLRAYNQSITFRRCMK